MENIVVSQHAIDRYRDRTGSNKSSKIIVERIKDQLSKAEEYVLKQKFKVIALLSHNFEESQYFKTRNGMIFVVLDNTVKTVHEGTADRWEKK